MDRRTFLACTGAVLLVAPLAAEAQTGKVARAGYLAPGRGPTPAALAVWREKSSFAQTLKELGWVEGQNLVYERRWGESADQLHTFAAELVRLKVDVLVVDSCGLAKVLQRQTSTIPIVAARCGYDMVTAGLAASLARPGGNVTGVQILGSDLIAKRLQVLKDLLPTLSRVATLGDLVTPAEVGPTALASYEVAADVAARTLGIKRDHFTLYSPEDFPAVIRGMREKGDRGLLLFTTSFMAAHLKQIVDLAATHRIAVIYEYKYWVGAGGLMSYGPSLTAVYRRAAGYVDQILRGAKPGDLPIEQPTKFELVINLKTAKALGLTIPPSLLLRADEVIQ
jgi:putative tryptophan/tyrosine transport system substrate-binding protein